jgi:tetratricopeptide (TPR) repeat protein
VSIDEGTTDSAGRARLVAGLDLLASLVGNRGERAESESLLRRALAMAETAPRLPDADVAHAVVALGQALAARGADRDAEKLAARAVKLYEKTSPPQRAEAIDALNLVAALRASRGDLDEAVTVLRRAVRVGELEDARAGLKAMTFSHLGSVRLRQGRLQEAEPFLEQGLELGEVSIGGRDHPALVRMMQVLADCYRLRGRAGDAEGLYTRALAIADRTYGPHSSAAVASLSGLGHVAEARAEAWHREALEAAESALPPDDPSRAELLGNLAASYARQGEEGAAEHLYLRAMAALEHAKGEDERRSEVLRGLASLYAGQGRRSDAARIRRALDKPGASFSGAAPSAFSAENP